ncbi:uncharacterized protein LOC120359133 [Solenopsis invicta]|uniref:uncharacterized protein LOC120359133 n=1 Tax=Solenopsis invicta TaxID=13686 RepID=UPI00193D50EF|nr:uncharacterized protein LOC120359133 [Solenopsis invicta]
MNTSEIQHFSLNRILLLSVGLWPYNQSKLVSLQQILLFGFQISFVIYQVKYLLEQFMHVCNELKDENEINVMKKYARSTKRYTTRFKRKKTTIFLSNTINKVK